MSMNGLILTHATEAELATAVSKNLHALFHAMQVLPGCKRGHERGERPRQRHYAPHSLRQRSWPNSAASGLTPAVL
jgi:hypothetical protein